MPYGVAYGEASAGASCPEPDREHEGVRERAEGSDRALWDGARWAACGVGPVAGGAGAGEEGEEVGPRGRRGGGRGTWREPRGGAVPDPPELQGGPAVGGVRCGLD